MRLKKAEVKDLASFMGWDTKSTKKAIEYFREFDFPVDHDDFLRVCIKSSNKEQRSLNLFKLIYRELPGNKTETLAKIIEDEHIIGIYIFFNTVDSIKETGVEVDLADNKKQLYFYTQFELYDDLKDMDGNIVYDFMQHRSDGLLDYIREKSETVLEELFIYTVKNHQGRTYGVTINSFQKATEDIIVDLVQYCGFKIFKIPHVRFYVNESDGFFQYPDFLSRISRSINDPFLNRKEITKRRYWLIYCLVEKLMQELNFGTLKSFRKVSELLDSPPTTIQTRYYNMRKIYREKNLRLDQIVREHALGKTINKYLSDIER